MNLAWLIVNQVDRPVKFPLGNISKVGSLGEKSSDLSIVSFIATALVGTVGMS